MTGVPLLDPELFPAFIATAELGNLRSAAASTQMTPTGLCEHLAKLEAQLGRALFVRRNDSFRVTNAGQFLLEYARRELQRVDEMFERLNPYDERISGLVSWVMPASCMASRLLPDLLRRLSTNPELRYSIRSGDQKRCIELVCTGEVDFALVHEHATDAPVVCTPLVYEECVVVSAATGRVPPSADGDSIAVQPLVFYPGCEDYYALWWNRARVSFAAHPLRPVHVSLEIDSVESAIASVIAGAGVSVFPRHCVEDALAQGRLTAHPLAQGPFRHRLYVARRTTLAPPARVQQVLDWLKRSVATCKPELGPDFNKRAAGNPS